VDETETSFAVCWDDLIRIRAHWHTFVATGRYPAGQLILPVDVA